jgi:hypothetical protein
LKIEESVEDYMAHKKKGKNATHEESIDQKSKSSPDKKLEWIPTPSGNSKTKSFPIPEGAQIIAYCPRCKKIIFAERYETNRSFLFGAGGLTQNYHPSYPVAHEIKCPIGSEDKSKTFTEHYCMTLYTF